MSIYNSMQSGISGLTAQSQRVSKIADNVANVNTVGYKRNFVDLVTSTSTEQGAKTYPAGVLAIHGKEVDRTGTFSQTNSGTDLAIAGDGFFVVSRSPFETNSTNFLLTRAGSFKPDENGYLVNSAGYYLQGYTADQSGSIGAVDRSSFADMKPINVKSVTTDSQATTAVSIKGNLPSQVTGQATPGSPYISTSDYFTPLGDRERLTYQWQPTSTPNQYDLTILGDNGSPIGSASVTFSDSGPNAGRPLSYTNIVDLSTAPASFGINPATGVATLTINNGTTPQVLTLSMGAPNTLEGITQFAGDYTPQEVTRNGSSASELARTEIGEDGFVRGIFTNGETRILFQIPIADVRNPNGLLTKDGNAYALSNKSGAFSLSDAGVSGKGEVLSNTLEMSNVDLALELTDLIQAQRSYSSSAKIITTADEMLDETTRLKR